MHLIFKGIMGIILGGIVLLIEYINLYYLDLISYS